MPHLAVEYKHTNLICETLFEHGDELVLEAVFDISSLQRGKIG